MLMSLLLGGSCYSCCCVMLLCMMCLGRQLILQFVKISCCIFFRFGDDVMMCFVKFFWLWNMVSGDRLLLIWLFVNDMKFFVSRLFICNCVCLNNWWWWLQQIVQCWCRKQCIFSLLCGVWYRLSLVVVVFCSSDDRMFDECIILICRLICGYV